MARSLSTETKQYTQKVEDDGQENDARNTQATIPSETRPSSLLYTTIGSLYTSLKLYKKLAAYTQVSKGSIQTQFPVLHKTQVFSFTA